jgi:plasmid stability protein
MVEPRAMPTLSIKNVPENLVERLRERARRNHRSLQSELMAIVSQAAEQGEAAAAPRRARPAGRTIEDIAAEHRARWKEPFRHGPSSTEMIRGDRDAR